MTKNDYKIDNRGNNQGLIIGENTGNIEFTINSAGKIPSLMSIIIKSLGDVYFDEDIGSTFDSKKFKVDEKIEYNCVHKYKDVIRYFAAYYPVCEEFLNAYDDSNMRGKAKILNCIYLWYMKAKGAILLENKDIGKNDIDIIKENSDKLIDMVQNEIYETVKASDEMDIMYKEDMELGIACFTCYCFMKCKILEKPL